MSENDHDRAEAVREAEAIFEEQKRKPQPAIGDDNDKLPVGWTGSVEEAERIIQERAKVQPVDLRNPEYAEIARIISLSKPFEKKLSSENNVSRWSSPKEGNYETHLELGRNPTGIFYRTEVWRTDGKGVDGLIEAVQITRQGGDESELYTVFKERPFGRDGTKVDYVSFDPELVKSFSEAATKANPSLKKPNVFGKIFRKFSS